MTMTTLFLTIITVSSIMLIIAFIFLYGEPKNNENKKEHNIAIKPYHYDTFSEISGEEKEKYREEAEKEHTIRTPLKEDNEGIDIKVFEEQMILAKNKETEDHLRIKAGKYILQYETMLFFENLVSKLQPEEQDILFETLKMAKEPKTTNGGEKPWDSDLGKL